MINLIPLFLFSIAVSAQNSYTSVSTATGVYQGSNVNLGTNQNQLYYGSATCFKGIAYAQAPVGNLRYQSPQQVQNHSNVYDATYFRPKCPQPNAGGQTSEDCLYLNVYTTQNVNSSSAMAVMVFIDGTNGFTNGGSNESEVKGIVTNLVQREIVVVTVQYRLGALGFFTTYTGAVQSNLGMLDQVQALQWVQTNIRSFGGDPSRITLVGQDDGACAVSAHTLSPMSQNLFNQAVIQSGSIYSCYNSVPLVPGSNINLGSYQAQEYTTTTTTTSPANILHYDPGMQYSPLSQYGNTDTTTQSSISTTPSTVTSETNAASFFDDPNQQLAQRLCNISAQQWNEGQIGNLHNCLSNYTVDIIMQHDNGMNATWMIVRDNNFLPDSLNNLAARRTPIPIIIGTVQDEDADYVFKLINTGNGNSSTSDDLNNWLFDFSRKNKLNAAATDKVGNVVSQNYGVPLEQTTTSSTTTTSTTTTTTTTTTTPSRQYDAPNYGNAGVNYNSGSTFEDSNQQTYYNQQGASTANYSNYGNMTPVTNGQNGVTNLQSLQTISEISSDAEVSLTTTEVQQYWQNGNKHVRIYQFTHVTELGRDTVPNTGSWKPVFKGQDMYFVTMSETVWSSGYTQQDRQVADQMGQKWTDFAKTGQVQNWDTSNSQNYNYCNLNSQPTQQAQYGQNARQIFQDQVNPVVNQAQQQVQAQTGLTQRTNWGGSSSSASSSPAPSYTTSSGSNYVYQPSVGPAQAQYTSYGNGNDRFQVSFQVQNFPTFGGR